MKSGYRLVHIKMLQNPVCCKSPYHIAVWICLILNASYEEYDALNGKKRITLRPGQVLMSLREIEEITKVPKSTVDRILKYFEKEGQVGTNRNGRKLLISLNNWDKYQKIWDNYGTKSGTVQTQTIKGKTGKSGTDFGTINKDILYKIRQYCEKEKIKDYTECQLEKMCLGLDADKQKLLLSDFLRQLRETKSRNFKEIVAEWTEKNS